MGRPAKFDREDALEAAMNHFWATGYEKASVSDLADVMGITRSSFYNSFGSREDVFEESLKRYNKQAPDRAFSDIKAGDRILPVLEGVMRALCRERAQDTAARGCMVVNCLNEAGNTEEAAPGLADLFDKKVGRLEALFTQARDQDEIDTDADATVLARETVAFLCGLNLASKYIRNEASLWAMCESFLEAHALLVRNPLMDLDVG